MSRSWNPNFYVGIHFLIVAIVVVVGRVLFLPDYHLHPSYTVAIVVVVVVALNFQGPTGIIIITVWSSSSSSCRSKITTPLMTR